MEIKEKLYYVKIALKKAEALEYSVKELGQKIRDLKDAAQTICPHVNTKVKRNYFSGSYYDAAYDDCVESCTDCGKSIRKWEE